MRRVLALLLASGCLAGAALAQPYDSTYFTNLTWRNIGPYRGGRCLAVGGSVSRPREYYFGATGGGVWKTTDAGAHWSCVSDGFLGTASVGAVAVSQSNPDVVYIGTGERDIRGDISRGDGVYKTTDGGKTWSHIGLIDSENISRIAVDPKDPNRVYVAALGHVYGPSDERGIFSSVDGGKTWTKALFVSNTAGAIDLCMDPSDPQTLFAATWEAWRTPYHLNSGGPGSHLFKTTDGGQHWTDVSKNPGMPKGILGKIGVAVAPTDPRRVYAIVEAEDGGVFKSDDGGLTWTMVNNANDYRQRAWYFSHIYVDPKDENTVYALNVGVGKSTDGGKTFSWLGTPHSDNHDLWIATDDSKRMIESNDGGAIVSTDGGASWSSQEYPTGEFYHVTADNAFPYHLLGAQQDNSTVRIASRTEGPGIGRLDWTPTAGFESGYVTARPDDPDVVFGGNYSGFVGLRNHRTNETRDVSPWPDNPTGYAAKDIPERFQWTFPIVFSPNNPNVLYCSDQYIYKTTNYGQSWQKISPDLSRNDPKTLVSSGGPLTQDNSSVEYYGTVFTLAESPGHAQTIYAGSDDGLVHITRDGGATWTDITPTDMPHWGKVSIIEASPFSEGTAYMAVDNHENDDIAPYVYRTSDFGKTWTKIVTGVPNGAFARSVRCDPKQQGLLYLGTETGVYASFDDGTHWQQLQLNLPNTPVHDLTIHDDDLCIATHGRGFWILDNITSLRQLAAVHGSNSPYLLQPRDAYRVNWSGWNFGRDNGPMAPNPPSGVILDYYLPAATKEMKLEFLDGKGAVISTLDEKSKSISTTAGMHRVVTTLVSTPYKTFPGMVFWNTGPSEIPLPPGDYQARLTVGTTTQTRSFKLVKDPRIASTDADLQAQYYFSMQIRDRVNDADDVATVAADLLKKIDTAVTACKDDKKVTADAAALKASLTAISEGVNQDKIKAGEDALNYPIGLNNRLAALLDTVQGGEFRPTDQSRAVFTELSAQVQSAQDKLKSLEATQLVAFNALLKAKGVAEVTPSAIATTKS